MSKKILLIDDSALMRSVLSDIINSDKDLEVADCADGAQAGIVKLRLYKYDCIVLDSVMPRMKCADFLKDFIDMKINSAVVVLSYASEKEAVDDVKDLGIKRLGFIQIPSSFNEMRQAGFRDRVINTLRSTVSLRDAGSMKPEDTPKVNKSEKRGPDFTVKRVKGNNKLIAIACSTGGPKALQSVVPKIPENIDAPILIVQHMPKAFTNSLAVRLDSLSDLKVKEADEGDILEKGVVYIAKGGYHMAVSETASGIHRIRLLDDPPRTGLKPCANVMYESLTFSGFENITCVVMTGMGNDGTSGIQELKTKKKIYVIAQDKETSTVYGMPKAVHDAGLTDEVIPLEGIADAITRKTGVH